MAEWRCSTGGVTAQYLRSTSAVLAESWHSISGVPTQYWRSTGAVPSAVVTSSTPPVLRQYGLAKFDCYTGCNNNTEISHWVNVYKKFNFFNDWFCECKLKKQFAKIQDDGSKKENTIFQNRFAILNFHKLRIEFCEM